VLSRSVAIPRLRVLLAAPVTRTIRGIPSELRLGPDDGLATECVAAFDSFGEVEKAILTHRMCVLGPERIAQACVALRAAVDC
jgi:mRNA interferase MazF